MIAKGRVLDKETNQPIPGANVAEYTLTNQLVDGTVSDLDGNFTKQVSQGNVIRITAIGYGMNQPLLQDNVHKDVLMTPVAYDQPMATVTAKRTYYKYWVAAIAIAIIGFIYYQQTK